MPPKPSCECGTCLTCRKRLAVRKFREKHPERWAAIQRKSQDKNRDQTRAYARERWANDPEVRRKAAERRANEREKAIARTELWRAIKRGVILKPASCEIGEDCLGQIEGHHDDYSKPLEVRWLCKRHHQQHHAREKKEGVK